MNAHGNRMLIAFLLSALIGMSAFALDNTLVDDYWNTTGYVNQPVQEMASPALTDAFETPCAATDSAGTAQQSAFSSWFSSLNLSLPLPRFNALGPMFLLMFK